MTTGDDRELISPEQATAVAEIMQALSSAVRVRILDRLRRSPCTVGELATAVAMEQPAVSNHLRLLRHLGLVTGRREGRQVHYEIHDQHVATLVQQTVDHVAHHTPGHHTA
ncbi:ArsR/SmtB family transcription factor [Streptoverticillium reticulum]|uniref:ArsR/SmtB family transcription factor n=1 Tax=Streptoverticillium reticulum TaxID=1433415 RepID=UPI0039BF79A5